MKNTKLIFIGMLAVVLAFGLVFTSCEGPTGATGPAGANGGGVGGGNGDLNNEAANLAAFGVAFSNPEHTSIGRDAVYEDSVVTVNVYALASGDGVLTVEKENSAVTFPYASDDFSDITKLNAYVGRVSNWISSIGLSASVIPAPGDEIATPKKLIRFKGDSKSQFRISVLGDDTGIGTFFDIADTESFPVIAGVTGVVRNKEIVSERDDYWTFKVTSIYGTNSIVDIKYADKTLGTVSAAYQSASQIADKINRDEETGVNFQNYGDVVQVWAANGRALAATEVLPTISFNTDYAAWGYRVYAEKIVKYEPDTNADTAPGKKAYAKGKDITANSTLAVGDRITIQVDDKNPTTSVVKSYKDTIVFKSTGTAAAADISADILTWINDNLYKTKSRLATAGAVKDPTDSKYLYIEALNEGTRYAVKATEFGTASSVAGVNEIVGHNEIPEQWFIGVDGGFGADAFIPTNASRVALGGGATPNVSAIIVAASLHDAIVTRIHDTLNNSQPNAPTPEPTVVETFKADYDLGSVGTIEVLNPETGVKVKDEFGFVITDRRATLGTFTVVPSISSNY